MNAVYNSIMFLIATFAAYKQKDRILLIPTNLASFLPTQGDARGQTAGLHVDQRLVQRRVERSDNDTVVIVNKIFHKCKIALKHFEENFTRKGQAFHITIHRFNKVGLRENTKSSMIRQIKYSRIQDCTSMKSTKQEDLVGRHSVNMNSSINNRTLLKKRYQFCKLPTRSHMLTSKLQYIF